MGTPSPLHDLVDRFFAADGPLARALPGYRPRTAQVDMAHAVADAFADKRARLVVEAGTGVGKSLAYLAPAFLSKKRALVCTATKALQDQLFDKDAPLAWACARELLAESEGQNDYVLVKGRQNYLCKMRFEELAAQPMFAFPGDASAWPGLVSWAHVTKTGDRAEVPGLPEPFATWSDLDAGSEHCVGLACPQHEQCFVTRVKRNAAGARLVIANHHLLCADLKVRRESARAGASSAGADGAAGAAVLPDVDLLIVDEAHTLPDVASDWFGVEIGKLGHDRLLGDARRFADSRSGDERAAVLDAVFACEDQRNRLWARLQLQTGSERQRLADSPQIRAHAHELDRALEGLIKTLDDMKDEQLARGAGGAGANGVNAGARDGAVQAAERSAMRRRVGDARVELGFVLGSAMDDAHYVVVIEQQRRGATVSATPVDVAAVLQKTVLALDRPIVLTSATLAVHGTTSSFQRRMGLVSPASPPADQPPLHERVLPSPFDFARRAALYCPKDMPEPDHATYPARYADEARFLLDLVKGGALFLFTSYAGMERGYADLLPLAQQLGVKARKQGDAQKRVLLDELRAADGETGALLCATHSFWEGVDVRGRALRLVCIDRLPFKVPSDPVRRARADLCKKNGGDPFTDIAVPEAALALKQGAGRLLRDVDDAGIVAILDGRLRARRYGATFLETLPPMARIGGRRSIADFFTRFVQPALGLTGEAALRSA